MQLSLAQIVTNLSAVYQQQITCKLEFAELTLTIAAADLLALCSHLSAAPYHFNQLIDLAGIDYATFPIPQPARFGAVYHLLSLPNNLRIRIKTYCVTDPKSCIACSSITMAPRCNSCGAYAPWLPTLTNIWPCANWYEREAFDLYGIIFTDHPDLTRILTEDSIAGHALRKDFPVIGKTEVCYDPKSGEITTQPVSIIDRTVIQKTMPRCGNKQG